MVLCAYLCLTEYNYAIILDASRANSKAATTTANTPLLRVVTHTTATALLRLGCLLRQLTGTIPAAAACTKLHAIFMPQLSSFCY